MNLQKPKRFKSDDYLAFIRSQPCIVTGKKPCDPHHTRGGGMATKCSDHLTVPLYREPHSECHQIGTKTFQAKYNVDFIECQLDLMRKYYEEKVND